MSSEQADRRPPPLLKGQTYEVCVRNLHRLLREGWKLAEARLIVLSEAGLDSFPPKMPTDFPTTAILPGGVDSPEATTN